MGRLRKRLEKRGIVLERSWSEEEIETAHRYRLAQMTYQERVEWYLGEGMSKAQARAAARQKVTVPKEIAKMLGGLV